MAHAWPKGSARRGGIKPEDLSCSDLKTHESYPHPIKISSYGSATVSRWRRPGAGEGEGGGGARRGW
jgi:hypothetical protein